jgi:hypothetical protein
MRHWGDRGSSGWQGSLKLVFLALQSTASQFSRVAGEVFLVDYYYCTTIMEMLCNLAAKLYKSRLSLKDSLNRTYL